MRRTIATLAAAILLAVGAVATPAQAAHGESILRSGEALYGGNYGSQYLVNGNPRFVFYMQGDCNVVIYDMSWAVWATNTYGFQGWFCQLVMQTDGNLVLYVNYQNTVCCWAAIKHTATYGNPGAYLVFQLDGNAVIRRTDGTAIWHRFAHVMYDT